MSFDTQNGCTKYGNLGTRFYVQKMKKESPDDLDPTLSLEKNDVLGQVYYKYAREDRQHPESYRVLKALYKRHI